MIIISTTRFLRNQIWELRMKKRYEALIAWLYKDTGKFPTEIKLTFLVLSLYGTFITWGYLQEKLTSTRYVNIDQEVVQWKFPIVLNLFVNLSAATTALFAPYLFYNQNKSEAEKEKEKEKKALMLNQLQQRHNQQQQQNNSSTSPIAATTTSKKKKIKPEAPFYCYWKPALSATVATALSYISLAYISYPLMILSKSCKHVPVMFIGRFFYRKKYHWSKYVSVFFICLGILLFTALKTTTAKAPEVNTSNSGGDKKNEFAMSLTLVVGLVFVFIHLILDGVTSNEQDSLFTNYSITSFQMMQNINLWQIIYSVSYLGFEFFSHYFTDTDVSSTRLYRASNILLKTPACVMDICVFCCCACVGQLLIFDLIREFGSLIWITVSVTRQLFTILLSVFLFHHSLSSPQWIGIIFVFSGLGFEIVMNYVQKQQAVTAAAAAANTPTATPRNETPRHESPRRPPQQQSQSLSPQHAAKKLTPEIRSQSRGPSGGGSLSARSPRKPESAQGGLPPLPLAGNVRKSTTPPFGGTPRIDDNNNNQSLNSARGRPVSRDAGRGSGGSNYNSPRVMDWNSPPGQQTGSSHSTSHNNNNFSSISSSSTQKRSNLPLLALHSLKKQQQAYPFDQSSSPGTSARTTELDLTPVNSGRRSAGSSSSSYNNTPRKHDSRNNSHNNLRKLSGMSPPPPSTDEVIITPRSGAESLKETILSNY
jgi:UDP-galactose transporter B1